MNEKVVTDLTQIPEDRLSSCECAALARGITTVEVNYPETSWTACELQNQYSATPTSSQPLTLLHGLALMAGLAICGGIFYFFLLRPLFN